MLKDRITITVDGLAASGKTALARMLAEKLGFAHLNTGLLYRGVGLLATKAGINLDDESFVLEVARAHNLTLKVGLNSNSELAIDGELVAVEQLNSPEISKAASKIAQYQLVRTHLLPAQQNAFPGSGLVAEGRDMGTIVFPESPVKFFVEARLEVRAQRRFSQLQGRISDIQNVEQIAQDLEIRDRLDASREIAPMIPAKGAVIVDNSDISLEATVALMAEYVSRAI